MNSGQLNYTNIQHIVVIKQHDVCLTGLCKGSFLRNILFSLFIGKQTVDIFGADYL